MKNLEELSKYDTFIYDHYDIEDLKDYIKITYYFEIPNLEKFTPTIEIPKKETKQIDSFVKELAFHMGMVELISYWKCCCPKNVLIKCGYLNEEQITWFKKLYFLGLGEFFYTNHIEVNQKDFINIKVCGNKQEINPEFHGDGVMIAVGGGKDSCVSLELLKEEKNRSCFIINPKPVTIECAKISGLQDNQIIKINRQIDSNIKKINSLGFLNGHTPFSAMVAFTSFLTAYLNDKKYIVLSNESSANESNIAGTKINHQYSKSYEFEIDFNKYVDTYFKIDIHYFSFLRPLNEYQIGMLLAKMPKYHQAFKSCNPGSLKTPWEWCCNCSKCLFVFSMLSPFLYKEDLVAIFKSDLFEKKELLKTFKELLGYGENKPFDCVGTFNEINYAVTKTIHNLEGQKLPYLLNYYKENYPLSDLTKNLEKEWNNENNLEPHFENILKGKIMQDE